MTECLPTSHLGGPPVVLVRAHPTSTGSLVGSCLLPRSHLGLRALHSSSSTDPNSTRAAVVRTVRLLSGAAPRSTPSPKTLRYRELRPQLPTFLAAKGSPFLFVGFVLSECVAPIFKVKLYKIVDYCNSCFYYSRVSLLCVRFGKLLYNCRPTSLSSSPCIT